MSAIPAHIVVAGRMNDAQYHAAKRIVETIAQSHSNVTSETIGMFESNWERFAREKSAYFGVEHKISPIVYYNGKNYIGGIEEFLVWVAQIYQFRSPVNTVLCNAHAKRELRNYITESPHSFAYFDISIGGSTTCQRIVFELFQDICPRTCSNFISLCENRSPKLSYLGTEFHRVVPQGWIQGGDVVDGSGKHSLGHDGEQFGDESFAMNHDCEGILSMANMGKPHTNGSQYFISLTPMTWMNEKMVAFGKVVVGMRVLRLVERIGLRQSRPVERCIIVDCGRYTGQPRRNSLSCCEITQESECKSGDLVIDESKQDVDLVNDESKLGENTIDESKNQNDSLEEKSSKEIDTREEKDEVTL